VGKTTRNSAFRIKHGVGRKRDRHYNIVRKGVHEQPDPPPEAVARQAQEVCGCRASCDKGIKIRKHGGSWKVKSEVILKKNCAGPTWYLLRITWL